jgi:hypothetical protein
VLLVTVEVATNAGCYDEFWNTYLENSAIIFSSIDIGDGFLIVDEFEVGGKHLR